MLIAIIAYIQKILKQYIKRPEHTKHESLDP